MSLSTTFVLVISVSAAIVFASPLSRRSVWSGGKIEDRGNAGTCVALPDNLREYCNYNYTHLPNRRNHRTLEEAQEEFNDYAALINANTRCSDFLGTFLCFYYFPLSNCHKYDKQHSILPCKETCLAAKNENCTALVTNYLPQGWAEHLHCDQFALRSSQTCSYGKNTRSYISSTATLPPPTTTQEPKNLTTTDEESEDSKEDSMSEETTEEPTEESEEDSMSEETTEEPTEALPECPKSGACSFRDSASGKVFKVNHDYSFALKATVVRKIGTNECEVNVITSYPVRTCINKKMEEAPETTGNVILKIPYGHCSGSSDLCSTVGQTVIIAGTHETKSDDSVELQLDCSDKPLYGNWENKYDRRLSGWVTSGNEDREMDC